jgi:hypothetical protein
MNKYACYHSVQNLLSPSLLSVNYDFICYILDQTLYTLFNYVTLYKEFSYIVIGFLREEGRAIQSNLEVNDKAFVLEQML